MTVSRIKPPSGWPFTGRTHPEGATLQVINIHAKWADLVWLNPKGEQVYLSTLSLDKVPKADLGPGVTQTA